MKFPQNKSVDIFQSGSGGKKYFIKEELRGIHPEFCTSWNKQYLSIGDIWRDKSYDTWRWDVTGIKD